MSEVRRIILGVTGSIAAVKSPMIARELMRHGFDIACAMTTGAEAFVTSTALAALTRNQVHTAIFPAGKRTSADAGTWHVHLARSAEAMLIAPCSATTIGKLANGIYDNAVTLLASSIRPGAPLFLAPAMDEEMWLQPVVQDNLEYLRGHGVHVLEPVHGALASGLIGKGRMNEPQALVEQIVATLNASAVHREHASRLSGKRVLITGGPTYEPIDPVRFIGNRSSGKMAAALANAAVSMGASVKLIMGPSTIQTNGSIDREDVETAGEMFDAVLREFRSADIIIMSAAVSDFSPETVSKTKIKKRSISDGELAIRLKRTEDILSTVAKLKQPHQQLIGFALETGDSAEEYAKSKLNEKSLDMIVLNRADESGAGFGHDTNRVTLFTASGSSEALPLMSKAECARQILIKIPA